MRASEFRALMGFAALCFSLGTGLLSGKALSADWVVTGVEIVEGGNITLARNLEIQSGGDLTLRGVTLEMASGYDGQYEIRVRDGGSMTIEAGCAISRTSGAAGFKFAVDAGSAFVMRDSGLSQCGWGAATEDLGGGQSIMSGARGLAVDADYAVIEGNTLSNNHVGVVLTGDGITLADNDIHSNTVHGIYTHGASDCQIEGNSIEHATVSSPFRMVEGGNHTVVGNTIQMGVPRGGIEVFASDGNTFQGNSISGLGAAIMLYFCSHDNVVLDNGLYTNEAGVIVWGWNNRVEDNTIENTELGVMTGIFMVYAYNSVVAGNTMSGIDSSGIWLRHSSNNAILNNVASGTPPAGVEAYYGILLNNTSKRNVIYGNQISDFSRGISLFYGSDENTIVGNGFSGNTLHAALVDDAAANTFYGNNFIGSGRLPYDSGVNQWDHEGAGNYWSDYPGADADLDGIGDEPYPVGPQGVDRFPLIAPLAPGALPAPGVKAATRPVVGPLLGKTVTGTEVIEDQTIYLGNIQVESGADLTLRNVHLITGGNTSNCSDLGISPGGSLTIEDCEITHLEYGCGFQLQPPAGSTLVMRDSLLQTCGHEWPYGGLQISADDVTLEDNHLIDTWITFFGTSGGRVEGNTIEKAGQGISLSGSSDKIIAGNTIRKTIGVAVQADGSNNAFTENTIYGGWEFGINVHQSDNCTVEGNTITNLKGDRAAISVGGDSIRVADNFVSGCGLGIRIGQGHTAQGNTIINCSLGMEIGWDESHVETNSISGCDVGMDLSGAFHTLVGNVIHDCDTGVSALVGAENAIHHNTFLYNGTQAVGNGANHWDDGAEGNYWTDYGGSDADADGIGDTPYAIASGGVDNYPLTNAYCPEDPVELLSGPTLYETIAGAYSAALNHDAIRCQARQFHEFTGDLHFDRDIWVTLAGGYDCFHAVKVSETAVSGTMIIGDGTVIVESVVIQ